MVMHAGLPADVSQPPSLASSNSYPGYGGCIEAAPEISDVPWAAAALGSSTAASGHPASTPACAPVSKACLAAGEAGAGGWPVLCCREEAGTASTRAAVFGEATSMRSMREPQLLMRAPVAMLQQL